MVRLRLADSNEIVAKVLPPRNDVAQPVHWDLANHAGKRGYLEVVDGLSLPAFAWLAVGRFDPPVIAVPKLGPDKAWARLRLASQLAAAFAVLDLEPPFRKLITDAGVNLETRLAAARTILTFHPQPVLSGLVEAAGDLTMQNEPRLAILDAIAGVKPADQTEVLARIGRTLPQRLQVVVAIKLAESSEGAQTLFKAIEKGDISPEVLRVAAVKEKLLGARLPGAAKKIDQLTAGLPPMEGELAKLLERRANYRRFQASSTRGRGCSPRIASNATRLRGRGP